MVLYKINMERKYGTPVRQYLVGKTMKITVYHGGTERVDTPVCHLGRENLDFGKGSL